MTTILRESLNEKIMSYINIPYFNFDSSDYKFYMVLKLIYYEWNAVSMTFGPLSDICIICNNMRNARLRSHGINVEHKYVIRLTYNTGVETIERNIT